MAKYSMKVKGKEIGPASTYSTPHTMDGKAAKTSLKNPTGAEVMKTMNMSSGLISKGNYKPEKTDGIKIRGVGAATKGVMARGPMG
jgi:hypothetical protein